VTNPVAKTFYTHRVFLIYQPDDYRGYLKGAIDSSAWPPPDSPEYFRLSLGLLAWGTILVYRAKMLPFDFNRELKRLVDENGKFIDQDPSVPVTRPLLRKQLAMQLGIEAITRREYVKERIAEVPVFQQYLYDTLYWPQDFHEKGPYRLDENGEPANFQMTPEDLRQHLWFRATGSRSKYELRDEENFAPPDVVRFLFFALEEYIDLLASPREIRTKTMNYARQLEHTRDQELWATLAEAIDSSPLVTSVTKSYMPAGAQ